MSSEPAYEQPSRVHAALAAQRRVEAQLNEARQQALEAQQKVVDLERRAGEARVRVSEALEANATAADGWLNYEQAAEYLSMSLQAIRDAVYDGKVPAYGEGRSIRFCRAELDAAVRAGRLNGGSRG